MIQSMYVRGKDFEEDGWEDPSMGGWLTFYVVCQVFSILLTLGMIYQLPWASAGYKCLLALMLLMPVYSVAALILQLRNAVFLTICSLALSLASNAAIIIGAMWAGNSLAGVAAPVSAMAIGIAWIFYFILSHQVKVRFPIEERKVYWFDAVALMVSCAMTILSGIGVLNEAARVRNSAWNMDSIQFLREESRALDAMWKENLYFTNLDFKGNDCVVAITADLPPEMTDAEFKDVLANDDFGLMLKCYVLKYAPEFAERIADEGGNLRISFYRDHLGDGADYLASASEICDLFSLSQQRKYENKRELVTEEEIYGLLPKVEALWPDLPSKAIHLESFGLNEGILTYNYVLDESKQYYTRELADDFEYYVGKCCISMMETAERGDNEALEQFRHADLDIRMRLKGSRTGYSKQFDMMSPSFISNSKAFRDYWAVKE